MWGLCIRPAQLSLRGADGEAGQRVRLVWERRGQIPEKSRRGRRLPWGGFGYLDPVRATGSGDPGQTRGRVIKTAVSGFLAGSVAKTPGSERGDRVRPWSGTAMKR